MLIAKADLLLKNDDDVQAS